VLSAKQITEYLSLIGEDDNIWMKKCNSEEIEACSLNT